MVILASDDLRSWEEAYGLPATFDGTSWSPDSAVIDSAGGFIVAAGEADWNGGRDGGTVWALVSFGGGEWHLTAGWPSDDMSDVGIHAWAMDDERAVIAIGSQVWYSDLTDLVTPAGAGLP